MEWMLIPLICLAGLAITLLLAGISDSDAVQVLFLVAVSLFILSLLCCPITYYSSANDVREAETYYREFIAPNIVEEHEDYVLISNHDAALWQAGTANLSNYNSYITSNRYWDSIPLIGTCVAVLPDYCKYARVLAVKE